MCVVHAHKCLRVCANAHTRGNQSKTLCIFLYSPPSYCIERGSLTELKPQHFGQTGCPVSTLDFPVPGFQACPLHAQI